MSRRIPLTIGDTTADLVAVVMDRRTRTFSPLNGCSAAMLIRAEGSDTVLHTLPGVLLTGREMDNGQLDTTYVVAGSGGRVQFSMVPMLGEAAGNYTGTIVITYPTTLVQTIDERLEFALSGGA